MLVGTALPYMSVAPTLMLNYKSVVTLATKKKIYSLGDYQLQLNHSYYYFRLGCEYLLAKLRITRVW